MNERPLRVLLVEASGRGFLSHKTHALAHGLQRADVETQLLTGRRDELNGWSVPFHKQACLESGYRGWHCLRRHVCEERPDIVHLQWVDNPFSALRFVRWAHQRGIKVIYTPHNVLPHERRWLLMPAYRVLYQRMDRVVARDAHLAWALEELLETPQEQVTLLSGSPNYLALRSLDDSNYSPAPERLPGERRLLFFGHGGRRKGLDLLLTTVAGNVWPSEMHLVVAGEEVLRGIPQELLHAAQRSMRFTLIERYVAPQEVASLFRDSDLLLMPYIKQCKSPLLDLAAALRLPVLRSDRVQGAYFHEGVHGITFNHQEHSVLEHRLKQTQWLNSVRRNLQAMDDPMDAIDRLAAEHASLYLKVRDGQARTSRS
ncbi:MAG: glycosyltransferase, partial [Gammaproteobacteria bacterium]